MKNELLEKVLQDDEKACNELLDKYKLMIYSIINSYQLDYGDYVISKDDLFQEGCIGLFEACKTYKENEKTKFSTYAFIVIERRIKRCFFSLLRPYKKEYSIDKFEYPNYVEGVSYRYLQEQGMNYQNDTKDTEDKINNVIFTNEEDRQIIKLRLQHYSYKEIAEIMKISPKRVDNRISRIKKINKRKRGKK